MSDRPFDVRDDLRALEPYRAPQRDAPVRLNTNESPFPPPEQYLEDLAARVRALALHRYPDRDARALRGGLAARHGVTADHVWVANGSNEILQTLLLTFGGPGRPLLLFEPTYGMHSHLARIAATPVLAKQVPEPWTLDRETVAWAISFDPPALTFICSPNNPTGNAHPVDVVRAAHESGGGLVVVDEAYAEFGGDSALSLLGECERLAVVRSFSKSWRLAGARLGYLVAQPWLVEAIQVARLPYHLSATSQAAGEVALKHSHAMLAHVAEIVAERDRLIKEMERIPGVEVFASQANFALFRTPLAGPALWTGLADRGVLVRDFSNVIPRALRVTVGAADQNLTFVECLREILADAA